MSDAERVIELKWRWREACQGQAPGRAYPGILGTTWIFPVVERVDLGPPIVLGIRLLQGQLVDEVAAELPRIASWIGAESAVITATKQARWALVTLHAGHRSTWPVITYF